MLHKVLHIQNSEPRGFETCSIVLTFSSHHPPLPNLANPSPLHTFTPTLHISRLFCCLSSYFLSFSCCSIIDRTRGTPQLWADQWQCRKVLRLHGRDLLWACLHFFISPSSSCSPHNFFLGFLFVLVFFYFCFCFISLSYFVRFFLLFLFCFS